MHISHETHMIPHDDDEDEQNQKEVILEDQLSLWGGGVMGIILLVALAYYLLRRFTSPYKEMSILEDYLLLVLLILGDRSTVALRNRSRNGRLESGPQTLPDR